MDGFKNFKVVVNNEEQYSIWPQQKTIPSGWMHEGFSGAKEECLAHISRQWTDIRPLSLKKSLQ
jgi:MbtH protein